MLTVFTLNVSIKKRSFSKKTEHSLVPVLRLLYVVAPINALARNTYMLNEIVFKFLEGRYWCQRNAVATWMTCLDGVFASGMRQRTARARL